MKSIIEHIEDLTQNVIGLTNTKLEIFKLETTNKASGIIGNLIGLLVVVFIIISAFTVFNFGVAYWIGEKLENTSYGFFIVGGFYILIGLFFIKFKRKWIVEPFKREMLENILD